MVVSSKIPRHGCVCYVVQRAARELEAGDDNVGIMKLPPCARVEPHESREERKSFKSSDGDEKARHPVDKGKTKLHTIMDLT